MSKMIQFDEVQIKNICPVCGCPITNCTTIICPNCQTPHHKDCWDYVGGCSIYACQESQELNPAWVKIHSLTQKFETNPSFKILCFFGLSYLFTKILISLLILLNFPIPIQNLAWFMSIYLGLGVGLSMAYFLYGLLETVSGKSV